MESKTKLKGKIKKFSKKLYDKYDLPARQIIKEKLEGYAKDNTDIYAEDLLLEDKDCVYKYIELQVCATWIYEDYPHEHAYVYERKGHFKPETLYIILNKHMNRGLLFDKNSLEKQPCRLKKFSRTFVYKAKWKDVFKFMVDVLDIELLRLYNLTGKL